jgi:hypothetical protein
MALAPRPTAPPTTARLLGVVVVVGSSAQSACGKGAPSPHAATATHPAEPAVDRSSPEVVLVAAHRALSAGDLAGLRPYLSDAGFERLTADLLAWREKFVDSASGPRVASRVRMPEGAADREGVARALTGGDPADLLRALVRIDPREPLPAPAPTAPRDARGPTADRADLSMPAHGGESRLVRFVRGPDGWRIDHLPL